MLRRQMLLLTSHPSCYGLLILAEAAFLKLFSRTNCPGLPRSQKPWKQSMVPCLECCMPISLCQSTLTQHLLIQTALYALAYLLTKYHRCKRDTSSHCSVRCTLAGCSQVMTMGMIGAARFKLERCQSHHPEVQGW